MNESLAVHEAVDHFLWACRVERGLASNTLQAYGRDLSDLVAFLEHRRNTAVRTIDAAVLADWMVSLANRGLKPRTIARYRVSARQFFQFMVTEQIIDDVARLADFGFDEVIVRYFGTDTSLRAQTDTLARFIDAVAHRFP